MANEFNLMSKNPVAVINTRPFDVRLLEDKNGLKENYLVKKKDIIVTRSYYVHPDPPQVVVKEERREVFKAPVYKVIYGDTQFTSKIIKLPDEQPGVFYIVSDLIAVAAARIGRNDCLFLGGEVRDIDAPAEILGYYWLYKA